MSADPSCRLERIFHKLNSVFGLNPLDRDRQYQLAFSLLSSFVFSGRGAEKLWLVPTTSEFRIQKDPIDSGSSIRTKGIKISYSGTRSASRCEPLHN